MTSRRTMTTVTCLATHPRFLDIIVPRRLMIAGVSSMHARARAFPLYHSYTSFNYFLIASYPFLPLVAHFSLLLTTISESLFRSRFDRFITLSLSLKNTFFLTPFFLFFLFFFLYVLVQLFAKKRKKCGTDSVSRIVRLEAESRPEMTTIDSNV